MQRFKHILFAANTHDRDTVAWERAVALAQRNGAALTVFDAVRSLPADLPVADAPVSPDELLPGAMLASRSRASMWGDGEKREVDRCWINRSEKQVCEMSTLFEQDSS